jgi:hypothetical protein
MIEISLIPRNFEGWTVQRNDLHLQLLYLQKTDLTTAFVEIASHKVPDSPMQRAIAMIARAIPGAFLCSFASSEQFRSCLRRPPKRPFTLIAIAARVAHHYQDDAERNES